MDIDRATLRKISRDFRTTSSRLLNTDFHDADDNLKRFLEFVERCPVILGYITPLVESFNARSGKVEQDNLQRFKLPTDPEDEVAAVWELLKHIDADTENRFYQYASTHSKSGKINDSVTDFNGAVVRPFVNHIIGYLSEKLDEAGQSESGTVGVMVKNYGPISQLNLANQGSTIHAVNVQGGTSEVRQAAEELLQALADADTELSEEQRDELEEAASFVLEQSQADKPRKSGLRLYAERVKELAQLTEATGRLSRVGMNFYATVQGWIGGQ